MTSSQNKQHASYSKGLMQKMDQGIGKLLQLQYQPNSQPKIKQLLQEIVDSQQHEDWLLLRQLLQSNLIKQSPTLSSILPQQLSQLIHTSEQTYPMHIFLYSLFKTLKLSKPPIISHRHLKQLANQGKLSLFCSWLTATPPSKQSHQTLSMIIQQYPKIVLSQRLNIELPQLQFIITVLCHLHIHSSSQFDHLQSMLSLLKCFRIPMSDRNYSSSMNLSQPIIDNEQHQIIKSTIQTTATCKHATGTATFILNQQSIQPKNIKSFVAIYSEWLLTLSETQILHLFTILFRQSMTENCLCLFTQVSKLLKEAERFYDLKILYQKILLPIIVYRGKAMTTLQNQVLETASFYIIGFYQYCDIGINGLQCIISNLILIQSDQVRQRWLELAFLLADKNTDNYIQMIYKQLTNQGLPQNIINKINLNKEFGSFANNDIWQITIRNSRKLKTYPKSPSKLYKGIENNYLQCYIISVAQALFTTAALERILKQFYAPGWTSLSRHLQDLFESLRSPKSIRASVDRVKTYGPAEFSQSQTQQDAQQYLSKVLQKIQQELKQNHQKLLLQQFYKTFQFTLHRKLQCQNCRHVIDSSQEQFIYTISNKTSLREELVEEIDDYCCEKCKQKKFLSKITLSPQCKILILHINRFSFTQGKSRKELATLPIQRSFLNYKLKGIIFHIGKNVQCGHYVYYYNVSPKTWVQMNDHQVNQFQLQNENEQFERQLKSEMTPYILFYVKSP